MTVGERIKSLRSRACLTQTELGKRIGWPDSRIGAYERGEVKRPNRASIERLARAFEMTYGEFMDNVDMPKPRSNAMYVTNNARKMHGLPLWRKSNRKKRFYSRCPAEEVVSAFLYYCEN